MSMQALMGIDDGFTKTQAQAVAAGLAGAGGVYPEKWFENMRHGCFGDAFTVVLMVISTLSFVPDHRYRHRVTPLGRVFQGVVH